MGFDRLSAVQARSDGIMHDALLLLIICRGQSKRDENPAVPVSG